MNKDSNNTNFVLLAGCARSGTVLLKTLLNSHMNVAFPLDTLVIPLFSPFSFLWGDLKKGKNMKALISSLIEFLKIWFLYGLRVKNPQEIFEMSIIPELKRLKESSAFGISSFPELTNEVYSSFSARLGGGASGEHTTTVPVVNEWEENMHGMKVIHLIRDGRDISLSWMKQWFGPSTVVEVALRWKKHIKVYREWGKMNPDKYIEVYYEDLVMDTEKEVKRLSEFLGIELVRKDFVLDGKLVKMHAKQGYHTLIDGPIVKNNFNKWVKEMSDVNQELFELCAGDTLKECNYNIPSRSKSLSRSLLIRVLLVFEYAKRFFSIKFHRYWIRSLMPLVIWISQKLNIRISS